MSSDEHSYGVLDKRHVDYRGHRFQLDLVRRRKGITRIGITWFGDSETLERPLIRHEVMPDKSGRGFFISPHHPVFRGNNAVDHALIAALDIVVDRIERMHLNAEGEPAANKKQELNKWLRDAFPEFDPSLYETDE